MKVVLVGATGKAGSRIQKELLSRGHEVVAVVRDVSKVASEPGVMTKQSDLSDVAQIADIIAGVDVVVSAYGPPLDDASQLLGVTQRLMEAAAKAGPVRLIVVGGAATLEVAPGVTLLDSGHLPAEWSAIAQTHAKVFEMLKKSDIDWTYLSPSAFFEPGVRTKQFRLGKDQLLTDANGKSWISMEDYAIALVDELEKPSHKKQRFTVGY